MSNKQEIRKTAEEISKIKRELNASKVPSHLVNHTKNLVKWQEKHLKKILESKIKAIKKGEYDEEVKNDNDRRVLFYELLSAGNYYGHLDESYSQDRWYNEQWEPIFDNDEGVDVYEEVMVPMHKKVLVPLFKKYLPAIHKMLVERYGGKIQKPTYDLYEY